MLTENTSAKNEPAKPKRRLTPKAMLELKRLSEPRLHPDGLHVAFTVTEADFEESRWVSHLYLTEREQETQRGGEGEKGRGGDNSQSPGDPNPQSLIPNPLPDDPNTRQLTFSYEGESNSRWSPDGRFLAFVSSRPDLSESPDDEDDEDAKDQIWILPMEGGEARRLTNEKEGVLEYDWLPDASGIVYLATEPRPKPVESLRKETRERHKIDPTVEHEEKLRRQFWHLEIDSKKPQLLFRGDYGIQEFLLSPDGERIAYTTNHTGEWNDYHFVDLYVRDIEKGVTHKIVERAGGKYSPRWSPDGTHLAFLAWLDPKISFSRLSLYKVPVPPLASAVGTPVDGAALAPLTPPEFDTEILEFAWSGHNNIIYAVTAEGTGSNVVRILPDSGKSKLAFESNVGERRDLYLDGISSAFVYIDETSTHPAEIFLRDDVGKVHQLTKINAEFAETYTLPKQEVVAWNSPDGTRIEGVLLHPLDSEAEKPAPLVVQVHGGPKGRATDTLRGYYLHPVWATEGYAVLLPNFRGSEGYGQAFAVANRRDLGGGDFQDIMSGVDWCIAEGIADPERLGIMGGSYGGYMTNWAIGQTDRFKGAISQFGVFHLQTDYSNSELSGWDNDYLGAYYSEDAEIYRKLSPGSYLEKIQTPTLIIHGDDDTNTFISNSKELYQALRHRKVPTQFVHYPREGHGIQEPNHRLDETRRCLAWMDRYVRHTGKTREWYRVGDLIPHPESPWVLCVTRSEAGDYAGQPQGEAKEKLETLLWEIAFTLHRTEPQPTAEPFILRFAEIVLQGRTDSEGVSYSPMGLPLDSYGGNYLIEGDNLHLTVLPDSETGLIALAGVVVFRLPKATTSFLLKIRDFTPIHIELTEEAEQKEGKNDSENE